LCGIEPLIPNARIQLGGVNQAEIHECGFEQRSMLVQDHIGRFDVAVQDVPVVRHAQPRQQGAANGERVHDRQRSLPQPGLQRDARNEGHDQVDLIVLETVFEQRRERAMLDLRKHVSFVFEPHPRRGGERCRRRDLDHHRGLLVHIGSQQGSRDIAVVEKTQHSIATVDQSPFHRHLGAIDIHGVTAGSRRHAHLAAGCAAFFRNQR